MCWIGYAPKDRSQIPAINLENAHQRNDDAWGLMYVENGEVIIHRDITKHNDFREYWNLVPFRTPVAVHFRFSTSGADTKEMAHPFPVLWDGEGRVTLAMMHNGVLSCVDADKETKESDTAVLIRDVIRPMLLKHPDLIEDEIWRWTMGHTIGNPNKLLFMRNDGETFIVNDYQGKYHEGGVWHSNEYSIASQTPYKNTGAAGYGKNSGYHAGAYSSYGYGKWDDKWDADDYSQCGVV